MKKTLYTLFLVCAGIVLGSLAATFAKEVSFLSWLAFGFDFGITSPFVLDLAVLKLTLGLSFTLNVAVILCVSLSLLIGLKLYRRR